MRGKVGFSNEKYLKQQTRFILDRIKQFNNKLYLEFGGKIIYDHHASRVLPGYDPQLKIKLLRKLKNKAEIIICISAIHIEKRKIRADFGVTYDTYLFKMINDFEKFGLKTLSVVITRFANQTSAKIFKTKLERQNIKVYTHESIKGYPSDVNLIISKKGYGKNVYLKTKKPLVVVVAPGPGSGKLATCLSQIYHEHKKGIKAGYSKFETFPVWNLPLDHPINIAYEAATADIGDFNLIDPFHLKAYKKKAINYNRDIEAFPVVKKILGKIIGERTVYKSPTDMGVNRISFGIINDSLVRKAAHEEIIRRYFRYSYEYRIGATSKKTVKIIKQILKRVNLRPEDRKVVKPAKQAALGIFRASAIELKNGIIVTGKSSALMNAASSLIMNAIKKLAGIPDKIHLLSPLIINSIGKLKKELSGIKTPQLNLEETLITLSISAATNDTAKLAVEKLKELRGCEAHLTHIPGPEDERGLRKLGINTTWETNFKHQC